jgi:hypothetical protein
MTSMRLSSIFDPTYDGSNDVLHANSIEIVEAVGHLGRKVFQAADHEGEVALGLCHLERSLMPLLQLSAASRLPSTKRCLVR